MGLQWHPIAFDACRVSHSRERNASPQSERRVFVSFLHNLPEFSLLDQGSATNSGKDPVRAKQHRSRASRQGAVGTGRVEIQDGIPFHRRITVLGEGILRSRN